MGCEGRGGITGQLSTTGFTPGHPLVRRQVSNPDPLIKSHVLRSFRPGKSGVKRLVSTIRLLKYVKERETAAAARAAEVEKHIDRAERRAEKNLASVVAVTRRGCLTSLDTAGALGRAATLGRWVDANWDQVEAAQRNWAARAKS